MMIDIRNGFVSELINLNLGVDIAWENSDFKAKTGENFIRFTFNPVQDESCGKTLASADMNEGFVMLQVYEPAAVKGSYSDATMQLIDTLRGLFRKGYEFTYNGQTVYIDRADVSSGRIVDGWYSRDVTVFYKSFLSR